MKRDDGTASGIISIPTRMPLPKSNNNSKEFVKQVTLDYDDNYHDNVGSFINPELLFSQPPLGKQAAFDTTERTIRSQGHVVSERGKTNKLEFTRKSFGLPERTEIKDLGNFCSSGSQSCIEEVKSSSRISQKDFEDTLSSSLFQAVESPVEDCAKETSTYSGSSISFKCLHSSQSLSQKTEKNTNSLKSVIGKGTS